MTEQTQWLDMREKDSITTREAFGRAVQEAMRSDAGLIALSADTEKSVGFGGAAREFPDRVLNVGIAEQNMVNMAAGIAAAGRRVVAGTYAPFLALRAAEQVRTFVCYPRLPVLMGGALAGLSGGIEGVTHQGTEDIAVLRSFAGLSVVVPADATASAQATRVLLDRRAPAYIRLGRYGMPGVYGGGYRFTFGRATCLTQGEDVTLIACGPMVYRCLLAARALSEAGIRARVLDMSTVKPLDEAAVLQCARETGALITAEDHVTGGGLGGAVAEALCDSHPVPLIRLGLSDCFAESGDQGELMNRYGLSVSDVVAAARRVIARKER